VTPEANGLRIVDRNTGAEFKNVIEADGDAGWIIKAVTDEAGLIVCDGDELRTERLEGLSLRIDIDASMIGGGDFTGERKWREWKPDDTADGITELHKLPTGGNVSPSIIPSSTG
jgi:hypothetical protein